MGVLTPPDRLTVEIREGVERLSHKAALSHIETITGDPLQAVRTAASAGADQAELAAAIRREYASITGNRAEAIARSETNRAFTMSQYEADKQFLSQNELSSRAYKRWVTRSPTPCDFCAAKAAEAPIPFDVPFAELGEVLTVTETRVDGTTAVRSLPISYETVDAGNLHTRCACGYQLIIEGL